MYDSGYVQERHAVGSMFRRGVWSVQKQVGCSREECGVYKSGWDVQERSAECMMVGSIRAAQLIVKKS